MKRFKYSVPLITCSAAMIIYGALGESEMTRYSMLIGGLLFGFTVGFGQGVVKALGAVRGTPLSDEELTEALERIP